jgi:gliding motility-associated lipoprotein GldH
MLNKGIKAIVVSLLFLSSVSCDDKVIYFKQYSLPDHVWSNGWSAAYEFEMENLEDSVLLDFSFRTTTDFKYKSFFYFVEIVNPSGNKRRTLHKLETIGEQGEWLGKKTGSVVEFNKEIKLNKQVRKGKYKVAVYPAITNSELNQMLDLGLMVKKF